MQASSKELKIRQANVAQGPATPGEAPSDADVVHFAAFLTTMAEELSQVCIQQCNPCIRLSVLASL